LELRDTSSPAATTALNALLSTISELNKPLKIAPGDAAANAPVVQGFASAVFDAADAEDRGRGSDRGTARAFYAAVCFFEVCGYFGELPAALAERLAYARWKVADISKAVREGRVPRKGGPADWQRDAHAAAAAGGVSGAGGAVAAAPAGGRPDDDARRGGDGAHSADGSSSDGGGRGGSSDGRRRPLSPPPPPADAFPSARAGGGGGGQELYPSANGGGSGGRGGGGGGGGGYGSGYGGAPPPLPPRRPPPPPPQADPPPPQSSTGGDGDGSDAEEFPSAPPLPLYESLAHTSLGDGFPRQPPPPPAARLPSVAEDAPAATDLPAAPVMGAAQKLAKNAASALDFQDVATARRALAEALALLGGPL